MVNETGWAQPKIIASVRAQGGYCRKWASAYQKGVPDLIGALAPIGGFLMEIKMEKFALQDHWARKVKTTAKQKKELRDYTMAGGFACVGMVSYFNPQEAYLTILPPSAEKFTEGDLFYGSTVRREDGIFDMKMAFEMYMRGGPSYDEIR